MYPRYKTKVVARFLCRAPVMVGVFGIIASLNALQEAAQLALIQVKLRDEACPVDEVVSQQGQGGAWCGIRKSENVILPILFCTLQEDSASCVINSEGTGT